MKTSSARVSKSEPEGTKSEPKGNQREPKGNQNGAKESQKAAKGSQKGSQSEPKGDENAIKNRPSEKDAKSIDCSCRATVNTLRYRPWKPTILKQGTGRNRRHWRLNGVKKWAKTIKNITKMDPKTNKK